MLRNYLIVAVRNLVRHKLYSAINIAGLAVGMACCILIFLFVQDELSYDRFHAKADRIYRILWDARFGDNEWTLPFGPVPVAEALEIHFPEVDRTARLRRETRTVRRGPEYVIEKRFLYVEESFFDMFTVRFVAGRAETALRDPTSVVLTEKSARRYFPDRDALGQTLKFDDGTLHHVTGVVKGFPPQSHFHFDFLSPLKALPIVDRRREDWGSGTVYTYLVLKDGATADGLEAGFAEHVESRLRDVWSNRPGDYTRFLLQPLADIHLHSHLEMELAPNGDMMHVYVFSLIAVFILLLACINFVNLATARSTNRAREVGIRKVLGSNRTQIVRQFLFESFVYVALAVVLALGLSELGLPLLNGLADKQLTTGSLSSPFVLMALAGIVAGVAVLAGLYPALFLSSFWPVQVLKGRATGRSGRDGLRNGLVVMQFCISTGLLVGTLVVRSQLHYVQNKRLGFDRERVLVVHGAGTLGSQSAAFRERLESLSQVVTASATRNLPGREFDSMSFEPEQPANYERTSLTYVMADERYVETLGLEIAAGRNFSPGEFAADSSAFLINRAAAKALGWKNPVGRRLKRNRFMQGPVIGVVEDFHFQSFRHEIEPLVLPFLRWRPSFVAVRLQPGNVADAVSAVRQVWEKFVPHRPFAYSFLDGDYGRLYDGEQRVARVFEIFSALAIFIACLGLFGLATFTTEQRTKEIGIRKALGATVPSIVLLLSKDFVKLIVVANAIAWPVAYYATDHWLQDFAYRIDLGLGVFMSGGILALVIALATVSFQAIKAALANPVDALRYE